MSRAFRFQSASFLSVKTSQKHRLVEFYMNGCIALQARQLAGPFAGIEKHSKVKSTSFTFCAPVLETTWRELSCFDAGM